MNKPQKLYCKWKKLQKTSHCMIPFIYDVQIRQIYRDRKWLFRARGREIEEWRLKTAGFILKLIVVMNVQLCEYIRSHYVFSILSCPILSYSVCFLGPHLWHMEVPSLGTCTTAHRNARSLTHGARPGIEPTSSWILVRFVTAEPQWELQLYILNG